MLGCRVTIPAVEGVIQRQFAQLVCEQQRVSQRQARMLGQTEQEVEIQVLVALQLHLTHQRLNHDVYGQRRHDRQTLREVGLRMNAAKKRGKNK